MNNDGMDTSGGSGGDTNTGGVKPEPTEPTGTTELGGVPPAGRRAGFPSDISDVGSEMSDVGSDISDDGSDTQSEDLNKGDNGDPDLLLPYGAMPDGSPFVTVACTRKDKEYINQYGVPGAHWYRLQAFHDPKWEWDASKEVCNIHNRILSKKNEAGGPGWAKDQCAGIFGVVFVSNPDTGEENELDTIKPRKRVRGVPTPKSPNTYILIGWRLDPKKPKDVTKRWETRSDARFLYKKETDSKIYKAACEAKRRYLNKEQRELTPDLLLTPADLQQQRDGSVNLNSRLSTPVQQNTNYTNTNQPSSAAVGTSMRYTSPVPGSTPPIPDDLARLMEDVVRNVIETYSAKTGWRPATAHSNFGNNAVSVR